MECQLLNISRFYFRVIYAMVEEVVFCTSVLPLFTFVRRRSTGMMYFVRLSVRSSVCLIFVYQYTSDLKPLDTILQKLIFRISQTFSIDFACDIYGPTNSESVASSKPIVTIHWGTYPKCYCTPSFICCFYVIITFYLAIILSKSREHIIVHNNILCQPFMAMLRILSLIVYISNKL